VLEAVRRGLYQHLENFLARTITNILTDALPKTYASGRNIRDAINADKLRSELWWAPQYAPFPEELADTIGGFENESWWRPLKDGLEAKYAVYERPGRLRS
jgi:dTDP-D-glucose 4,6-dehydratase